jgi:hypothetical protein
VPRQSYGRSGGCFARARPQSRCASVTARPFYALACFLLVLGLHDCVDVFRTRLVIHLGGEDTLQTVAEGQNADKHVGLVEEFAHAAPLS